MTFRNQRKWWREREREREREKEQEKSRMDTVTRRIFGALSRYTQPPLETLHTCCVREIDHNCPFPCFSQGQAESQERPILVARQRNELVDQSAR